MFGRRSVTVSFFRWKNFVCAGNARFGSSNLDFANKFSRFFFYVIIINILGIFRTGFAALWRRIPKNVRLGYNGLVFGLLAFGSNFLVACLRKCKIFHRQHHQFVSLKEREKKTKRISPGLYAAIVSIRAHCVRELTAVLGDLFCCQRYSTRMRLEGICGVFYEVEIPKIER